MNKENVVENICKGQKKVRQTKVAARRINLVNQVVEHEVMMEVEQPVEPESRLPLGVKDIDSEDPIKCCWCCDVKVLGLKKSLCSGCLKARYCSLDCLRANWAEHGEWCERRQEERSVKEKKKKEEIRMEKIRRDIEEDDNVD